MIQRRKPLQRSTKLIPRSALAPRSAPPKNKRAGTRRGEPTKAEKTVIRDRVYGETGGRCEIGKSPKHIAGVLPSEGDLRARWHLVHLKGKRVHGWARENLCGGCYNCHILCLHNAGGKPCPPKPKAEGAV